MEKLRARPGIVMDRYFHINMLLPTRPAAEACRMIQPVDLLTSIVWSGLVKGSTRAEIRSTLGILLKKPDAELEAILEKIIAGLLDKGFLIEAQEDVEAGEEGIPRGARNDGGKGIPRDPRNDWRNEKETAEIEDWPEPVEAAFLELLRQVLGGEAPWQPELSEANWEALLLLAERHKLLPLVLDAVSGMPALRQLDRERVKLWRRQALEQLLRQTVQENEFLNLTLELRKRGLEPLTLKGPVCRSLYARPLLRPSVDDDLLIEPRRAEDYHRALLELGLDPDDKEADPASSWELSYHKPNSPLYLELHKQLFDPESAAFSGFNDWFEGARARAVSVRIQDLELKTLCPTDHLAFLILHAFKHFLYSGFGLRIVADICLFTRRWQEELDLEALGRLCESLRCGDFTRAVYQIGERFLGIPAPAIFAAPRVALEPLLKDVLEAGLHGNQVDRLHSANITLRAAALRRDDGSAGLRSSLFPSAQALSGRYPFLERRPWLLPVAWVRRFAGYAFGPKVSAAASLRIGRERVRLLETYGVIHPAEHKKE